ncbi:MAG TPA: sugar phosphate isomerase/epimerase [Pirellulaceae bacterium]|nr:sugar phosphate isomerase/epimerase [Pirellulaceae bacterium]HMO91975.1 sugar phosphate isomerase/epimerase [Pirellulaceae bacterium]HMP68774.1 sugar phosphate isomerase/epimerase [Pirellulaceae bacterium]
MGRWSISEFTTSRWSLERELDSCRRYGFRNIGIWNQKLDDQGVEKTLDQILNHQFKISSFSWIGGFTGCDGVSFEDSIKNAVKGIRQAAQLGAKTVVLYPGSKQGHTRRHAIRLIESALKEIVPCAFDYDIQLVMEPMDELHSKHWSVFDSAEETINFVTEYDNDCLGLVLDLYYVGMNHAIFDCLQNFIDKVVLVQYADRKRQSALNAPLGDQSRVCLFDGDVPLLKWMSRLEELGYEGFYEIELFGSQMESLSYEQRLRKSRKMADMLNENLRAHSRD